MRRSGIVVSALLAGGLLAGCSPNKGGWAGVSVDAQGDAVVLVQTCEYSVDWLDLSGTRIGVVGPSETPEYLPGARWTADSAVEPGTFTEVGAGLSAAPWTLASAPAALQDDAVYGVWAGSDSYWGATRTYEVTFTRADLDKLRPGQVLSPFDDLLTVEEFRAQACDSAS